MEDAVNADRYREGRPGSDDPGDKNAVGVRVSTSVCQPNTAARSGRAHDVAVFEVQYSSIYIERSI